MGIQLAVGDFETGCANMAHLRDLPLDAVKIDRRYTAGIPTSVVDCSVVRAIISLVDELASR